MMMIRLYDGDKDDDDQMMTIRLNDGGKDDARMHVSTYRAGCHNFLGAKLTIDKTDMDTNFILEGGKKEELFIWPFVQLEIIFFAERPFYRLTI